jgi:hypothetical protein
MLVLLTRWATALPPAHQPNGCQHQTWLGDFQQTKQNTFLLKLYLAEKKKSQKEKTKL